MAERQQGTLRRSDHVQQLVVIVDQVMVMMVVAVMAVMRSRIVAAPVQCHRAASRGCHMRCSQLLRVRWRSVWRCEDTTGQRFRLVIILEELVTTLKLNVQIKCKSEDLGGDHLSHRWWDGFSRSADGHINYYIHSAVSSNMIELISVPLSVPQLESSSHSRPTLTVLFVVFCRKGVASKLYAPDTCP